MVPFTGTNSVDVATAWFFGTVPARVVVAQAGTAGSATGTSTAIRAAVGTGSVAGAGAATSSATWLLCAVASTEGASTLAATATRWSHVAEGATASSVQVCGTATVQFAASGAMAGEAVTAASSTLSCIAIAMAEGGAIAVLDAWIAAVPDYHWPLPSRKPRFQRHAMVPFVGTDAADIATNWFFKDRVVALTSAEGAAAGGSAVLTAPTGTWRTSATVSGATILEGDAHRILTALGAAAGTSTARLDPTIHIAGTSAGGVTATGSAALVARGVATSAGHATESAVGRRVQYGRASAAGTAVIGATGSWLKTVYGYAEGQCEAVAGSPDWWQTTSGYSGCGSVMSAIEQFTGLILTASGEAAGSCLRVLAIPDANIVPVGADEPVQAAGLADAISAADLVVWPDPFTCGNQSSAVLDCQVLLVETPGRLAGDAQYAIAIAEASSFGWSIALSASDPIERMAEARSDGAAAVEYQEPIYVIEPTIIEGFADVRAIACSIECVEGKIWTWSGAEAMIAACRQEAEGVARGGSVIRSLGGFPLQTTVRRPRGNSAVSARATKAA